MSVFGSKITIFHCFSPKNHCLAPFGQDLSGDQGWYNTVRVMYCIVPIQYCNVMYCISNFSDKVVF